MASVSTLPTRAAVDAAWDRYIEAMAPAVDNPLLLLDRTFMENAVGAHREFAQAFNRMGAR